jgi:hypothetical protein
MRLAEAEDAVHDRPPRPFGGKGNPDWRIADNGDLLMLRNRGERPQVRRRLREALAAAPTWLDPKTGMPWL